MIEEAGVDRHARGRRNKGRKFRNYLATSSREYARGMECSSRREEKEEEEEARRQIQKLQLVNSGSARAEGYGNWVRTQCYVISSRLHVFPRLKPRSYTRCRINHARV